VKSKTGVPSGSGLGTSSSLNVALVGAILGPKVTQNDAAERAWRVEQALGDICGKQDQWAAAKGGFNRFLFAGDEVIEMPFEPLRSARKWLERSLWLVDCGIRRRSTEVQDLVWGRYANGDSDVVDALHLIRETARMMSDAFAQDRRDRVLDAFDQICDAVDILHPSIHGHFKDLIEPLRSDDVIKGWKAMGAGGGGVAGLLCTEGADEKLQLALDQVGWTRIDWMIDDDGLVVEEMNDSSLDH